MSAGWLFGIRGSLWGSFSKGVQIGVQNGLLKAGTCWKCSEGSSCRVASTNQKVVGSNPAGLTENPRDFKISGVFACLGIWRFSVVSVCKTVCRQHVFFSCTALNGLTDKQQSEELLPRHAASFLPAWIICHAMVSKA